MPGNSFGHALRITTAGESHGPANVAILDGVPPGLALTVEDLLVDLDRRRPGQSRIVTQRRESDTPQILSGVFGGVTTGTSLAILIPNEDQRSRDYDDIKDLYRPGHADFTFDAKYGIRDYRGGGRSSARETNVRVAAGVVAKKILDQACGARVLGYVLQVGDIRASIPSPAAVTFEQVERLADGSANIVRCPDHDAARRMVDLIDAVRKEQDSIGGIAEVVATGIPAGLGEPVFDKLKADLAKALLSLPAVTAFEYGAGFAVATARGSQNNDIFEAGGDEAGAAKGGNAEAGAAQGSAVRTRTNRHGGMLGGISSGMPIVLRAAVKPTSSLPIEQETVRRTGEAATIRTKGRHDPCLLPRFVPMAEAMVALVLADHLLRWQAQRSVIPRPLP